MKLQINIMVAEQQFQWNQVAVLDLGSGSGQDCYIASALVGEKENYRS